MVDRGLFPVASLRERYPLPEPSGLDDATDPRRARLGHGAGAVSYTHLDVYKRQALVSAYRRDANLSSN